MIDFDTFTKLPKNVGDLGKLIVAKGFKNLSKVQKNRPIWSHWSWGTALAQRICLRLSSCPKHTTQALFNNL